MRWPAIVVYSLLFITASVRAQELSPSPQTPSDQYVAQNRRAVDLARSPLGVDPYGYQIEKLYAERPSLFAPIATVTAGWALMVGPPMAVFAGWMMGGFSSLPDDTTVRDFRGVIIWSSVGVALAGLGTGWLVHRIKRRAEYTYRINTLREARRSYFSSIGAGRPFGVLHW